MKKLLALMTIITVPLSGCAMQQGDFPSLQKRPYEAESAVVETTPTAAVTSLPADVRSKLAAAVATSSAAHDQFQAMLPAVQARVDAAGGSNVLSEPWVVAQMELAALETERSPSVEAMADIDALYAAQLERDAAENRSGGAALIIGQRDAVQAQVDQQQAAIDAMKSRLR
ncbi:hypothetical protein [Parasphingorhabdus sp.]|uniref:hypothetical protein n=1 Tax=Parasphingorhabdus sp. TaxID=2709688 RepID=UPI003262E8CB